MLRINLWIELIFNADSDALIFVYTDILVFGF